MDDRVPPTTKLEHAAAMLDLLRFARYAFRFERAFKSDRWDAVRRSFHDDASYEIAGTGTAYDGVTRGASAIIVLFQKMLNEVDRKYDRRQPRLVGRPRMESGEVVVRYSVRYVRGSDATILTGTSRCRFERGRIRALSDTMPADETHRWLDLVGASWLPQSPT